MLQLVTVLYVLIAIAMIALILMQRGAGAAAGSGFGGGGSATVFGARGSANFLSKATKWLAIAFFGISLGMAWYATHSARPKAATSSDLGVMAGMPAQRAPAAIPQAAAPASVPQAAPTVPAATPVAPAAQPVEPPPASSGN